MSDMHEKWGELMALVGLEPLPTSTLATSTTPSGRLFTKHTPTALRKATSLLRRYPERPWAILVLVRRDAPDEMLSLPLDDLRRIVAEYTEEPLPDTAGCFWLALVIEDDGIYLRNVSYGKQSNLRGHGGVQGGMSEEALKKILDGCPTEVSLRCAHSTPDPDADPEDDFAPVKEVVVVLSFSEKGFGFGEVTLVQNEHGVFLDTECMSVATAKRFFAALLDKAIPDTDRDPARHKLYNQAMGRTCGPRCSACNSAEG